MNLVLYQLQKIVGDELRPEGGRDPEGVADSRFRAATGQRVGTNVGIEEPPHDQESRSAGREPHLA